MSARVATRLAWAIVAVSALLLVTAVALHVLRREDASLGATTGELLTSLSLLAFGWIGALIVSRQPNNPIGWLSCGCAMVANIVAFGNEYAIYGLITRPGSVPAAAAASWLPQSGFPVFVALLTSVLLLFPTGRPPTPQWAWVLWLTGISACGGVISNIELWPQRGMTLLENTIVAYTGVLAVVQALGVIGLLTSFAAAIVSLVLRFRSATSIERQQIKWLVYAISAVAVALPAATTAMQLLGASELMVDVLFGLLIALIPLAVGVAILKHRLYDIDHLISRTIVYTLLTALLATVYSTAVLVLGLFVGDLQSDAPSWTIAAATLTVAALFQPTRRRLQQTVARRFNRRSYDAAQAIGEFSSRLRDDLDSATLTAELLAVVDETMQPAVRSLWLHPRATVTRPASYPAGD